MSAEHSRPQSPSFLGHVVGKRGAATGRLQIKPSGSGDENGRERFFPLPDLGRSKEITVRRVLVPAFAISARLFFIQFLDAFLRIPLRLIFDKSRQLEL